jgi:hypothetical protein
MDARFHRLPADVRTLSPQVFRNAENLPISASQRDRRAALSARIAGLFHNTKGLKFDM